MTPALELQRVCVSRGGQPIVRDASASVQPRSWFGIIGANGSGKTTLLRAVAGRLPITSGSCAVEGRELATIRAERARNIGFAPPIEHLPAGLQLKELLTLAGGDIVEQEQRCDDLWHALQISSLLGRKMGECSSGMRQRASIALAFANPVSLVILDEPFNWLDPVAAFDTREALAAMVGEGLTLITALHDMATLCGFCDAGIVMTEGRVTLTLSADELNAGQQDQRQFERGIIGALRR